MKFSHLEQNSKRDAFILYVERCRPDLFGSTEGPVSPSHSGQSFTGGNACPKRYHTDEKNRARTHRRVPTEVLEGLLSSWQNEKCYTLAEFGAVRLGPPEVRDGVGVSPKGLTFQPSSLLFV